MSEPRADRPNMPAYGLAAADEGEGLLPWSWAEERLRDAKTYWVATVRDDGAPHVAPVWGLWFDDAIVFSTSPRSRKARNIARDARCVVTIDHGDEAVIAEGVVEAFVNDRRDEYVRAYDAKYHFDMSAMDDPLYALRPHVMFGFIDSDDRFVNTATRWTFL